MTDRQTDSSEIWGFSKSKEIERIHMKFCKRILGVKSSTCNMAIYGELGRYPLYINRYTRIIKFWCKIIYSDNIIIKKLYEDMLLSAKDNWAVYLKSSEKLYLNYVCLLILCI